MQTIGIIGGIGPEATVGYYRLLIAGYRRRRPDGGLPPIVIDSIDMHRMLALLEADDRTAAIDLLATEVARLARAGADLALLASNTPHIVFDELQERSPLPLISIVEATCAAARRLHLGRLGLVGTALVMSGRLYPDVFSRADIAVHVPEADEQEWVHAAYMRELVNGLVVPATRDRLLEIVGAMQRHHAIQALILGGTDLSIMFSTDEVNGIPLLDTTRIHVDAALDAALRPG